MDESLKELKKMYNKKYRTKNIEKIKIYNTKYRVKNGQKKFYKDELKKYASQ